MHGPSQVWSLIGPIINVSQHSSLIIADLNRLCVNLTSLTVEAVQKA